MKQYLDLLTDILSEGYNTPNRTGVDTISLIGQQMRFDLSEGFPLLTTKKVNFKAIAVELLWFLRGETNLDFLHKHNVHIWDEWATEYGGLGRIYGHQWRNFNHEIDQISNVIESLKTDPYGRRHIVTAWNPSDIEFMQLPCCHVMFQFFVREGKLSCHLYQRSADMFLGVPFNIASYSLLTHMVAKVVGLEVGEFIWTGGDCHIYYNHLEQVAEQLDREERELPKLELPARESIFDYQLEDFVITGYNPYPAIKAEVAV